MFHFYFRRCWKRLNNGGQQYWNLTFHYSSMQFTFSIEKQVKTMIESITFSYCSNLNIPPFHIDNRNTFIFLTEGGVTSYWCCLWWCLWQQTNLYHQLKWLPLKSLLPISITAWVSVLLYLLKKAGKGSSPVNATGFKWNINYRKR